MATKNSGRSNENSAEASDPYEEPRAAVKRIFDLLQVTKVVVVDDELNRDPHLADFLTRCRKYAIDQPARLKAIIQVEALDTEGVDFDTDIRPELEALWNGATDESREKMLSKMDWIAPKKTFAAMKELLRDYELIFLSLGDWQAKRAELTTAAARKETLFLFDLDMQSEAQGRSDEGMRIIKELLEEDTVCRCGLISHLVQKEYEYGAWQAYISEHSLQANQHRFVVISKKHLPDSPTVFAQRLKRAAISSPCNDLKRDVGKIFDQAFEEAKKSLEELNVFDFEEIVFQSSHEEGVWEPDTVLRILAMYTQRSARTLLKSSTSVEQTAARIRDVIDIAYRPSDAPAPSSRKIMRLENYEDGSFLQDHHIPLDLGDIFRRSNGTGEFILLAQPRATALLRAFTAYLSRDGFDHDLTRTLAKTN